MLDDGRYLLFVDILGFSNMVESQSSDVVYETICKCLEPFDHWSKRNSQFKVIYFSDTFVFYQDSNGYGDWAFLDVYAIGGMILSSLLAKGIAARGAISFGEFVVRPDASRGRDLYYGNALIEAYKAEQAENWIGITILASAWKPFGEDRIALFEREGVWKRRDDVLFLNPFIRLLGWYDHAKLGEIEGPMEEWDVPEFPNDIAGFRFLHQKASEYAESNDFTSRIATKYHSTIHFLREVFDFRYDWACEVAKVK
ncbi:MAG TPA: hypothetical protein DDW52_13440 [Planctomycetaceae bacterium]|nr:hypothetical protein [Planctomycetaceae bacterium]